RAIRSDASLAATPLVLVQTAGARSSDLDLDPLGFQATLSKPVRQSSLFNALLDVFHGPVRADIAPPARTPARGEHASRSLGLRVLLAEDNAVNQRVAIAMLERWSCHTRAVATGREVLAA